MNKPKNKTKKHLFQTNPNYVNASHQLVQPSCLYSVDNCFEDMLSVLTDYQRSSSQWSIVEKTSGGWVVGVGYGACWLEWIELDHAEHWEHLLRSSSHKDFPTQTALYNFDVALLQQSVDLVHIYCMNWKRGAMWPQINGKCSKICKKVGLSSAAKIFSVLRNTAWVWALVHLNYTSCIRNECKNNYITSREHD